MVNATHNQLGLVFYTSLLAIHAARFSTFHILFIYTFCDQERWTKQSFFCFQQYYHILSLFQFVFCSRHPAALQLQAYSDSLHLITLTSINVHYHYTFCLDWLPVKNRVSFYPEANPSKAQLSISDHPISHLSSLHPIIKPLSLLRTLDAPGPTLQSPLNKH